MENITDFDFYLKFTKPLILNLPQINDRVLAAAWVKRLSGSETEDKIKLDYLKLLLFMLQRKKLTKPFTQHPSGLETLEAFPENQTLVDVAKTILEQETKERRAKAKRKMFGEKGPHRPYVSDFSADLLEYVAVQEIDDFGVHAYYAISKEPLHSWFRVDKQLLPKAAKSMLEVGTPPPTLIETHSSPELPEKPKTPERQEHGPVEVPPAEGPPEESPSPEEPQAEESAEAPPEEPPPPLSPPKKSPRKSSLGATPPSRPIGKISPPPEDREPPTWGSNLLEAKYLEEDARDIVKASATMDEFVPVSESTAMVDSPMRLLYASPVPGEGFLDDVSPAFGELDSSRESLASFLGSEVPDFSQWTEPTAERASVYGSPPRGPPGSPPGSPPRSPPRGSPLRSPSPPPRDPTPPPKPKPVSKLSKTRLAKTAPKSNRAAELLQKKKAAGLAPKPPSPWKKARDRAKRKAKKEAEKAAAPAPPPFSPGEPFRGFPGDDVQQYLDEYKGALRDLENEYLEQEARMHTQREREAQFAAETSQMQSRPKRQLSRVAKMSAQRIPKAHEAAVELDKSIHVSPEARQLLEGIIEGPSTSTGITHPPGSPMRHPVPKLYAVDEGEEDDFEEMERMVEEEMRRELGGDEEEGYATTEAPPGSPEKDPRLVEAFNTMLDTSTRVEEGEAKTPEYDFDDFEAMERAVEEEMRRKGEDPRAKQRRIRATDAKMKKRRKQFLDVHHKADDQYEDLEEWTAAPQFFEEDDRKRYAQMSTPERLKHVFPDMEIEEKAEKGDLLDGYDDFVNFYQQHLKATPGTKGVPVTVPRPSLSPKRPTPPPYGGPPDDPNLWKFEARFPPPGSRLKPLIWPESPPVTADELLEIPSPSQIIEPRYLPAYHLDWQSPEIPPPELHPVPGPPLEAAQVSPQNQAWAFEMADLHQKLFPTVKTVPDFMDVPADRMFGESPPSNWASPVSPQLSPPIDATALRAQIAEGASPPRHAMYDKHVVAGRTSGGKTRVKRYSHPTDLAGRTIHEEYEPPTYLTAEDIDLQDELKDFEKLKEAKKIHVPHDMRKLRAFGGKKAPVLEPICDWCESPASDISEESLPEDFAKPASPPLTPPIDEIAFNRAIREGALHPEEYSMRRGKQPIMDKRAAKFAEVADYRTYGRQPKLAAVHEALEAADEEEQQHMFNIMTQGPKMMITPKDFRKSWKPGLSPIGDSPVEYPDSSPRARREVGSTPTDRQGPSKRRTTRKKMHQRRLDFDQTPGSDVETSPFHRRPPQDLPTPSPGGAVAAYGTPTTTRWEGLRHWRPTADIMLDRQGFEFPETPETPEVDFGAIEGQLGFVQTPRSPHRVPYAKLTPDRRRRERAVMKELAKKKLDFDEPQQQTDNYVEIANVQTLVTDLEPKKLTEVVSMDPFMGVEGYGSPEGERFDIGDEEMPEPELPWSPQISPMSEFGVLEKTMEEVKQFEFKGPKKLGPKRMKKYVNYRDLYKRYPWRKLDVVEEQPLKEALIHIREQTGRELEEDAEYKAALAALQAKEYSPAKGLIYETPPELRERPAITKPDYSFIQDPTELKYRDPEQQELDEFEMYEKVAGGGPVQVLQAEPEAHAKAYRVLDTARAQYNMLFGPSPPSPPRSPSPPRPLPPHARSRPRPPPQTMAELHEATKRLPASPEYLEKLAALQAEERKAAEAAAKAKKFEYEQKIKEKKAAKEARLKALVSRKSSKTLAKEAKEAKARQPPPKPELPKRKKFNVVSKIDTGKGAKKKKAPPAQAAAPPVIEVQYDLAGLQDLGVRPEDLAQLQIDDEALRQLESMGRIEEQYEETNQPLDAEPFPEPEDLVDFDEPPPCKVEVVEYYDPGKDTNIKMLAIKGTVSGNILGVVSPNVRLNPEEEAAMIEAEAANRRTGSFGPFDYTWGGRNPIQEDLRDFRWMTASEVPKDWPPLDEY